MRTTKGFEGQFCHSDTDSCVVRRKSQLSRNLIRTTKRAAGAQGCRAAAAVGGFGAGWAGRPSPSNLTRRARRRPARFRQAIKNRPKAVSLFPGGSGEIRTHEQFNPSLVFKSEKYSFNINDLD